MDSNGFDSRRDRNMLWIAIVSSVMTILTWIAMAVPLTAQQIQRVDWYWHDAMVELEWYPLTIFAAFLSAVGGLWVAVPVWVLILIWLWRRENSVGFWTCLLAVISSQLISWSSKISLRPFAS